MWTLRFWATLWTLRDNVRCSSWAHWKAHSGLPINDNWTFFTRCYGWRATSENRSKIGDFAPTRSIWPTISGRRAYPCKNYWWGTSPSTWNFGLKWPRWSEIADFRSIFARSASAVKHLAKKVQLSLIRSPLRAFQWAQDEHRTLSLSPQRVAQKRKVSKIWTISCDISETVWDSMIVTINH